MQSDRHQMKIAVRDGIHLSAFRRNDATELARHLNDREIYERTLRIPYPYSAQDAADFIEVTFASTQRRGHPVHFAIRNAEGLVFGGCGFEGLTYGHRAEIGYWLARPRWGQGIMTDAVRAACDYALAEWKLVRITAHVFDFNLASARVLQKNQFLLEGMLRKHHQKDGRWIDSMLFGLVP